MPYFTDMILIPATEGPDATELKKALAGTGMIKCAQTGIITVDAARAIEDEGYLSEMVSRIEDDMNDAFYSDSDGITGSIEVQFVNLQRACEMNQVGYVPDEVIESLLEDAISDSCGDRWASWELHIGNLDEHYRKVPVQDTDDSLQVEIGWKYNPSCASEPDVDTDDYFDPNDTRGHGPMNYADLKNW